MSMNNLKKFPWYKEKKWTLDNFGPIVLPTKGMKIKLTEASYQRIVVL